MTLYKAITDEILSGPKGPTVGAFFDLDQTLIAGFSASAFVRERLATGDMQRPELYDFLLAALSFARGRVGFSGFLVATSAALRGKPESETIGIGERVFQRRLAKNIYPEARALVHAHQQMGHTLAIISSATPYQVDPFARDLGISHVLCTRLEVDNGVLTGRVVRPTCFGEGKAAAARTLRDECGLDLEKSFFYSDSHEDLPLLDAVGNPRPLNPNRRLRQIAKERQWPVRSFTSRGMPGAEDLARTAMVWASFGASATIGVAAGLLNRSRREGVNVMGTLFGELATSAAGIDLRIEGEEHLWSHRPAMFIFNHQSGIDAPLIAKMLRRDFTGVGKKEIRKNPIVGPIFSAAGMVFVDRANHENAVKALAPSVEALRQGLSLVMAPEGTRSTGGELGPFKKGAFHVAMQAGVPIIAIVFRNARDALPKGAVIVRSAVVEAVVLPPVDTRTWTAVNIDVHVDAMRARFVETLAD